MAITHVQLLHVDRILHGRGSRRPEEFLQLLDERTPIRGFFRWRWDTWAKTKVDTVPSVARDRDCFLDRVSDTMAKMYADHASDWDALMTAYLQVKHEELDRMFGTYEHQYQRNTQEWQTVGAVQVAPPQRLDVLLGRYPKLIAQLADLGLTPDMRAIQIHVPTRFTQGGESPWESGRSVLQLGRHLRVVERRYGADGIPVLFGLSWQFDTILAQRLEFTVVDSPDLPQNIMGAWYQLLNEDGSFNRKRLAHLQEHNSLPYRLKLGFRYCELSPGSGESATLHG